MFTNLAILSAFYQVLFVVFVWTALLLSAYATCIAVYAPLNLTQTTATSYTIYIIITDTLHL